MDRTLSRSIHCQENAEIRDLLRVSRLDKHARQEIVANGFVSGATLSKMFEYLRLCGAWPFQSILLEHARELDGHPPSWRIEQLRDEIAVHLLKCCGYSNGRNSFSDPSSFGSGDLAC
jgi:hypothetical protein